MIIHTSFVFLNLSIDPTYAMRSKRLIPFCHPSIFSLENPLLMSYAWIPFSSFFAFKMHNVSNEKMVQGI
jgi:hypothetical protein